MAPPPAVGASLGGDRPDGRGYVHHHARVQQVQAARLAQEDYELDAFGRALITSY